MQDLVVTAFGVVHAHCHGWSLLLEDITGELLIQAGVNRFVVLSAAVLVR